MSKINRNARFAQRSTPNQTKFPATSSTLHQQWYSLRPDHVALNMSHPQLILLWMDESQRGCEMFSQFFNIEYHIDKSHLYRSEERPSLYTFRTARSGWYSAAIVSLCHSLAVRSFRMPRTHRTFSCCSTWKKRTWCSRWTTAAPWRLFRAWKQSEKEMWIESQSSEDAFSGLGEGEAHFRTCFWEVWNALCVFILL